MAFIEGNSDGELSEEIKEENEKYGELMVMQKEPIEGIYRGVREVPGYGGKGKQQCHKFEKADGSEFEMRGFGLMDHILAKDYAVGDLLRVTYTGKSEKTGYHQCKIAKDDGNGDAGGEESL
tara:strand:- start:456 stop:821 length:366 start_codon:yes stop_codon:yes gene_type:complete